MRPAHAAVFDSSLRENHNAVLAGADFPDFLYACGSYADHHDAGEAAHWPPFQAAAVLYLRSLQRDPVAWTAKQRTLAAFIFGLAVHYVTDELWEGLTGQLGARRGFTEMIDAFQLGNDGYGNVAEGIANNGGDFYASWALDESNISAWDRVFPLEEMVKVYHMTPKDGVFRPNSTNFTDVTLSSLTECKVLFDLGLWALQSFGPLLYLLSNDGTIQKLPFIEEHLFDAPLACGRHGCRDNVRVGSNCALALLDRWATLAPPKRTEQEKWANAAADDADDRATHNLLRAMAPYVPVAASLRQIKPREAARFFVPNAEPTVSGSRNLSSLHYEGPPELRDPLFGMVRALAKHYLGERFAQEIRVTTSASTRLTNVSETRPLGPSRSQRSIQKRMQ